MAFLLSQLSLSCTEQNCREKDKKAFKSILKGLFHKRNQLKEKIAKVLTYCYLNKICKTRYASKNPYFVHTQRILM